jgi:hypothetical protein
LSSTQPPTTSTGTRVGTPKAKTRRDYLEFAWPAVDLVIVSYVRFFYYVSTLVFIDKCYLDLRSLFLAKTMDNRDFPLPIPSDETEEEVLTSILSGRPPPPPTAAQLAQLKKREQRIEREQLQPVKSTLKKPLAFASFTYNSAQATC